MLFRFFMHKKNVAQYNFICEAHEEFLNLSKGILTEEELSEVKEFLKLQEAELKERNANLIKLCDVMDLLIIAIFAQMICIFKGFEIGIIIGQVVTIFIMGYAYFAVDNKAKYLYIPTILLTLMSIVLNIYTS